MKNTVTFVTHSAGTVTWELPQGVRGGIPPSVKEAAEKRMSTVLTLLIYALCVGESAALRLIYRFGNALSAAETAQLKELMRIDAQRRAVLQG